MGLWGRERRFAGGFGVGRYRRRVVGVIGR